MDNYTGVEWSERGLEAYVEGRLVWRMGNDGSWIEFDEDGSEIVITAAPLAGG